MAQSWNLLVPAKRLATAKTRFSLDGMGTEEHDDLVLALLTDTLSAASNSSAVSSISVVTSEPRAVGAADAFDASIVPEPAGGGLNASLVRGHRARGCTVPVAVLLSDLPALRPEELTAALTAAPDHRRSVVTDAEGSGTTLLAVTAGPLAPAFGPVSANAHRCGGAAVLRGDWPGLRRDVDTAVDLAQARELGLGLRTAAWLARACQAPTTVRTSTGPITADRTMPSTA